MSHLQPSILSLCVAAVLSPVVVQAETTNQTESTNAATVVVTDKRDDQLSSKQTIDSEQIESTPSGNGNLSDYIKMNPSVRLSQSNADGFKAGEIKPESVQINGADASQTAYLIDGINVNNDLDPEQTFFDGAMKTIPGSSSEQAYYLDANLLQGIEIYSSNVPAKFGGFTGGAVVAETRQYDGNDGVQARYRTTRSSWASMQVDEHIKSHVDSKVPNGSDAEFQPNYGKDFYSIAVQKGLTDEIGMVIGFSRRESAIEQTRMISKEGTTDKQDHTRLSDNWLANFNWTPDVNRTLEVGFRYSDYQEGKYFADNIDSNSTDSHSAYGTTVRWNQYLGNGWLTATAAYDNIFDSTETNSNYVEFRTDVSTDMAFETGGHGDSQLTQQNYNYALDYALDTLQFGKTDHRVSIGASYQKTDFDFSRDKDGKKRNVVEMSELDMVLLDETSVIRAGNIHTGYSNYALYLDDSITWGDFTFRPGVRYDRDDYLDNNNVASRFAASWTVLPTTRLNLGLNRYYGRSFAGMKLAGEILKLNDDHTRNYAEIEGLKTPHADELMLGVDHNFSQFTMTARYVKRKNKDSIKSRQFDIGGNKVDVFANMDDFNVDIYTLQLSNTVPFAVGPTYWNGSVGADYLVSDRSDIDKRLDPNELVYLDGEQMKYSEMEQKINSSTEEWVVRVNLDMQVPEYDLNWSNQVFIKAPTKGYEHVEDNFYKSYNFGSHTQWDSRLRWQPTIYGAHDVYVQFDVLNVLNQVRKTAIKGGVDSEYGLYTPGRQFWLELGYQF